MNYIEIIQNNPIRFFQKYCKAQGVKVKRDDSIKTLLEQLELENQQNSERLDQFLNIINNSKSGAFLIHKTSKKIPDLDNIKHQFKTIKKPIEKRKIIQNTDIQSNNGVIQANYSIFTKYGATGPTSVIPIFDNYIASAVIGTKTIRTEGNLSFLSPVSIHFCNSLKISKFEQIEFNDEKFLNLQKSIEKDSCCADLKIIKHDKKMTTGEAVDTLGFKSRGKNDLQNFIHGKVDSDGKFIGNLSNLISKSDAETIINEQKFSFYYTIYDDVEIEVILTINRKGLFKLNQVPRCIYDFVEQAASKLK